MEKVFTAVGSDDAGSTTVDWIVLTAGIVLLAVALLSTLGGSGSDLAADAGAAIMESDA